MAIVDVRILVEGASDVEVVSKALQGLALGSEYNITISSIIPTTNVEIAKSAAAGADLLIIATDADRVGRDLAERLFSELGEMVGHVERMKLPLGHDLEHVDVELVRKELKNTLVRAGLKSLQILPEYMALRNQLLDLKGRYDGLGEEYRKLREEYEAITKAFEELKEENARLKEENEGLKALLESAKNIYRVDEAWKSLFPAEPVPDEAYIGKAVEKLGLAGKVIVGQGYIFAEDKGLVDELLRTVYLSLSIKEEPPKPPKPPVEEPPKPQEPEPRSEPAVVENAEVKPDDIEGLLKGL
ncbi:MULTISPECIES: toprim domain-containing protein [Thermococcus]|uniref:Topoisomerase n=1 Tax=Thermococcus radiotolerans TaxID=187880 RepID=A0A2Z2N754_9EURY|nr:MULTISPECIES: toprim domain-containing protein [Thermococcus]ASA77836.1 topoisomerase [Thermococcus sp. 5-4]ASJ13719.1 topoisomerase [Thermococcus radiotolerans]